MWSDDCTPTHMWRNASASWPNSLAGAPYISNRLSSPPSQRCPLPEHAQRLLPWASHNRSTYCHELLVPTAWPVTLGRRA
eukprot:scaffold1328_cov394-Prasinococcus_capsulatus_cf.AAC.4